jgi:hypothetical protein
MGDKIIMTRILLNNTVEEIRKEKDDIKQELWKNNIDWSYMEIKIGKITVYK